MPPATFCRRSDIVDPYSAPHRCVSVCVGQPCIVRSGDILVQPIDVAAYISGIPPDCCVRGSIANQFSEYVRKNRPSAYPEFIRRHPDPVEAFRSLPVRDVLLRLCDAARLLHPDVPVAEAIRRMGRAGYDAMGRSLLGKMLLGAIGKQAGIIYGLIPRLYTYAGTAVRARYTPLGEGHIRYDYDPCFNWLDCFQVGLIEGVAALCGCMTETQVHLATPYRGSLECRWF